MKLICNKEDILKAVTSVESIVKSKLSFTHLSNVLLATENHKLSIRATNSEISQIAYIDVEIEVPGQIVITQSKLANLLRNFPNGKMSIVVDEKNIVRITPSETKRDLYAVLLGVPSDDFPTISDFPNEQYYVLEKNYLRKMLHKVIFAVSSQPTRYALHGVFLELHKNQLALVATDTRKMALFKTMLPSEKEESFGVIVPYEALLHLQKNLLDEGPVNFTVANNQIYFKFDHLKISSNLINGEFPKYQMLLPQTHKFTMTTRTIDLVNAINASNSILDSSQSPKIIWKLSKDKLNIFSQESNYNEVNETIAVDFQGDDLKIGFNARMLLEVIRNIDTDEIVFNFNGETSPVIIKEKGRQESVYVVMPVQLSN